MFFDPPINTSVVRTFCSRRCFVENLMGITILFQNLIISSISRDILKKPKKTLKGNETMKICLAVNKNIIIIFFKLYIKRSLKIS